MPAIRNWTLAALLFCPSAVARHEPLSGDGHAADRIASALDQHLRS